MVGTTIESTSIPLDGSSMEAAVVVTTASSVETVVTAALVVAASSAGSSGLWVEVNDALSSTIGAEVTGTLSSFNVEDSGIAVADSLAWGQATKSHWIWPLLQMQLVHLEGSFGGTVCEWR